MAPGSCSSSRMRLNRNGIGVAYLRALKHGCKVQKNNNKSRAIHGNVKRTATGGGERASENWYFRQKKIEIERGRRGRWHRAETRFHAQDYVMRNHFFAALRWPETKLWLLLSWARDTVYLFLFFFLLFFVFSPISFNRLRAHAPRILVLERKFIILCAPPFVMCSPSSLYIYWVWFFIQSLLAAALTFNLIQRQRCPRVFALFWWWNILGLAGLGISAHDGSVLCGPKLILFSAIVESTSHTTHTRYAHIRAARNGLRVIYIQCGTDVLVLQLFILRTTQKRQQNYMFIYVSSVCGACMCVWMWMWMEKRRLKHRDIVNERLRDDG